MKYKIFTLFILLAVLLSACKPAAQSAYPADTSYPADGRPRVLASTTILADIAQNVAGNTVKVESLLPYGVDPHAYQPKPSDAAKIEDSAVLILNGAEYEHSLESLIENAGGERLVIEASAGLTPIASSDAEHAAGDPHFWLDPNNVIKYTENIRDGLSQADPENAGVYKANAEAYIKQLQALDTEIKTQTDSLTPEKRIIVTNHENLAYFAQRYGFTIAGAVVPSLSSEAAPSAQEMAALVEKIKSSGARALFLDANDNPELAQQIAQETYIKLVSDLYLESLTPAGGLAPTYLEMMRHNVASMVQACKG
jgi:ABC-type Zn uptake system ZnuABC Zn-binding protein ZnuA